MTAQKGKDLLLKVDSDGAESFTTVAGLRVHALGPYASGRGRAFDRSAGERPGVAARFV
jgi:hypothetical protein